MNSVNYSKPECQPDTSKLLAELDFVCMRRAEGHIDVHDSDELHQLIVWCRKEIKEQSRQIATMRGAVWYMV